MFTESDMHIDVKQFKTAGQFETRVYTAPSLSRVPQNTAIIKTRNVNLGNLN